MDYTLSNSYDTDAGTGNRMHEDSKAVPTAVTDLDMNSVIWSLMEVVKAAGLAGAQFDKSTPATYQVLMRAIRRLSTQPARVFGLVGAPASTTQFQLSAAAVVFRNPTTGDASIVTGVAAITNNIATAGPVANGRDQAAAFATGAWVHYWFISDGATVATIASLSPTAPTLPAGFTSYAYAGTMLMGAGILTPMRFRGNKAFYDSSIQTLAGAGNTSETANLVTTSVPPNAPTMLLMVNMGLSTNSTGATGSNLAIRHTSGVTFLNITGSVAAANQSAWNSSEIELPNISQQFYFLFFNETSPGNLSARQAYINVLGFTMPNGG